MTHPARPAEGRRFPRIERSVAWLQRAEEWFLAAAILVMAALTFANVFCRSLLDFSLAFAEELSQFLIIGVTFVGLSYAASRGRHIRMTALYDQLSRRWRKLLIVASSALTCVLLLALMGYAIRYVASVRFLGTASPVLGVPLYLVYCVAPLGLLLAAVHYALNVVRNLSSPDVYISFETKDEYEERPVEDI